MVERHFRKCSTFLATREMQIKTTLRFHLIPARRAKMKTLMTAYSGEDVALGEHNYIVGRSANSYSCFGNQYGDIS